MKKQGDKNNQLLVLETLNELIQKAANNDDDARAVSVAAVLVFNDGTTISNVSGELDRVHMTGLLVDLSNQVFFNCKQMELQAAAEDAARQVVLATLPTGPKPN